MRQNYCTYIRTYFQHGKVRYKESANQSPTNAMVDSILSKIHPLLEGEITIAQRLHRSNTLISNWLIRECLSALCGTLVQIRPVDSKSQLNLQPAESGQAVSSAENRPVVGPEDPDWPVGTSSSRES